MHRKIAADPSLFLRDTQQMATSRECNDALAHDPLCCRRQRAATATCGIQDDGSSPSRLTKMRTRGGLFTPSVAVGCREGANDGGDIQLASVNVHRSLLCARNDGDCMQIIMAWWRHHCPRESGCSAWPKSPFYSTDLIRKVYRTNHYRVTCMDMHMLWITNRPEVLLPSFGHSAWSLRVKTNFLEFHSVGPHFPRQFMLQSMLGSTK